jgi:glutathione S-transferase
VSNEEYVCDGRFTAADISVGYALQFAILNGLQDELPEGVARYLARLQARDAYRRAVRSEQAATA